MIIDIRLREPKPPRKLCGGHPQFPHCPITRQTPGTDPAVIQQLEALSQKVEALGKKQPAAESKAKPSVPSKPGVSAEKGYHAVQKGKTLYRISRKYKISVKELRKLSNLSSDQPIRIGQKLLVSPGP